MKKLLLLSIIVFISLSCFAEKRAEVTVLQPGVATKVTVFFDDGIGKPDVVTNDEGKKFNSPVAVVNYFIKKGWKVKEMHINSLAPQSIIRVYVITKEDGNKK